MTAVSLKDCTSPWDWLAVDSAGFARCCCHSRGLIGNLNETPFDEVWNGPDMLRLRRAVSQDSFVQYCKGSACEFALNRQSVINREGAPLPENRRIDFGDEGNSLDYTTGGWSVPHGNSTWTIGPRASIKISVLAPLRMTRTLIRMSITAYLGAIHPAHVTVCLNDIALGHVTFTNAEMRSIDLHIPHRVAWKLRKRPVEISLNVRDPISPKSLGVNDDTRELGIAVHWMKF
jgi:hypothetical protein